MTPAADTAAHDTAALIAEAFEHIAPAKWLVPDDAVRRTTIQGHFELLVAHAEKFGHLHFGEEGESVAVWFDQTDEEPPEIEAYDERLAAAVGPRWLPRFQAFDAELLAHHPHEPHHYLALLATRPGSQSRGLGGALLERHHAWLDANGIPAYLDAAGPRSRDLYLRHGYRLLSEPYHLGGDGPPMFPMWRDPR